MHTQQTGFKADQFGIDQARLAQLEKEMHRAQSENGSAQAVPAKPIPHARTYNHRADVPQAIEGQTFSGRQLYLVAATGTWGYYNLRNQFTATECRDVPDESWHGRRVYLSQKGVKVVMSCKGELAPLDTPVAHRVLSEFDRPAKVVWYEKRPTGHQAPKVKQNGNGGKQSKQDKKAAKKKHKQH